LTARIPLLHAAVAVHLPLEFLDGEKGGLELVVDGVRNGVRRVELREVRFGPARLLAVANVVVELPDALFDRVVVERRQLVADVGELPADRYGELISLVPRDGGGNRQRADGGSAKPSQLESHLVCSRIVLIRIQRVLR
jgi:hypothetical protein